MIEWYVHLEYLDIGVETIERFEQFLGVVPYSWCEDLSPISRSPDDVVFGFVYCMTAFSEAHGRSVSKGESSGRPCITRQSLVLWMGLKQRKVFFPLLFYFAIGGDYCADSFEDRVFLFWIK